VTGPRGTAPGRFVLDTGAVATTMIPELADLVGYSARDAFKRTQVHTGGSKSSISVTTISTAYSELAQRLQLRDPARRAAHSRRANRSLTRGKILPLIDPLVAEPRSQSPRIHAEQRGVSSELGRSVCHNRTCKPARRQTVRLLERPACQEKFPSIEGLDGGA